MTAKNNNRFDEGIDPDPDDWDSEVAAIEAGERNGPAPKEQDVITEFSYRGLNFKVKRADSLCFWQIKLGNTIVLRYFTLPHKIEADIAKAIQSIKDGVDAGRGLNIDYSKVQEAEA